MRVFSVSKALIISAKLKPTTTTSLAMSLQCWAPNGVRLVATF
jgi:hypothetical protein